MVLYLRSRWSSALSAAAVTALAAYGAWHIRPLPDRATESSSILLFRGIRYERRVVVAPRLVTLHVMRVELHGTGVRPFVTPQDEPLEDRLTLRTPSECLETYRLQATLNGDYFLVDPSGGAHTVGPAVSDGKRYGPASTLEHTLYFTRDGGAVIDLAPAAVEHAISGNFMLVFEGRAADDLGGPPDPRSAVGVTRDARTLILVVVDGRQPGYSEGLTLDELAVWMRDLGAWSALNLDGGGSSALVVEGDRGQPRLLNSPIHQHVPGQERRVATHLGFYAERSHLNR